MVLVYKYINMYTIHTLIHTYTHMNTYIHTYMHALTYIHTNTSLLIFLKKMPKIQNGWREDGVFSSHDEENGHLYAEG